MPVSSAVSRFRSWSLAAVCAAGLASIATSQETAPAVQTHPPSWQRIPGGKQVTTASVQGEIRNSNGLTVPGVTVSVQRSGETPKATLTDAEGIFRFTALPPGTYQIKFEKDGFQVQSYPRVELHSGELLTMELQLKSTTAGTTSDKGPSGLPGVRGGEAAPTLDSAYPGLRTPPAAVTPQTGQIESIPAKDAVFSPDPDRWNVALPEWSRYGRPGEFPYVRPRWYDPFNTNRIKADKPIFGQLWFLDLTAQSISALDERRLYVASGISAQNPVSSQFFGHGQQFFLSQDFRFTFDLFRGDAGFRPIDFRFRVTPQINLNFLKAQERGIVNIDVRKGTDRFDDHVGLQEAFVEAKIHDLSPNFDFVSVRAGIQQFTSDFRGFIFSEEQPGVRVFGNLHSNRINYNLAYFYFLEKNTNSGLNTFDDRHQQVYIGNVYIQDSFFKGYTTQFSFHYNRDDPSIHYDDNGFLVRPAPIGQVVNGKFLPHGIRAYYIGWTSNGHIGRVNVSHAFYQALGHDTFNPIAGRRVDIDARMAALELSVDKDWARLRASFFYSSGDPNAETGQFRKDGTAHGFDTIVDDTHFAGGAFSFFNNEGIRLLDTGVALTSPASLLPSLRSNKEEGQANFVNPGLYLFNVGADFDVTPKLRAFTNASYLRFDRTEPLQILLFEGGIPHSIGEDFGVGAEYRPPLTENIVINGGASALIPGDGFQTIYNDKVLFSVFGSVRLVF